MSGIAEPLMVKYLHDKGVREGIPVSGNFELTQRCNFNCKMCYVHDCANKTDLLSTEEWLSLGEQAKEAGTVFLLLTGGEPLLRKDFTEIYTGLVKMGFFVSVNTNGSLLDSYIDLFKEYPPLRINVSLYGADNSTYKTFCGNEAFEKIMASVKSLKEYGVSVRFNSIFTPDNISDYKKMSDISKALVIPFKPTTYSYPPIRLGQVNESRFAPEAAAEYMNIIDEYHLEKDYYQRKLENILKLEKGPKDNKVHCRAGRASFWITADGIMRPCGMMSSPDSKPLEIGFKNAWEQTKAQTQQIRLPEECLSCRLSGICNVCAAMCMAETGAFDKVPEYVCRMTKHLYTLAERSACQNEN